MIYVDGLPDSVICVLHCQIVPVLHPREAAMEEPTVKDFIDTDEFQYYVEDREVMYSGCLQ